MLATKVIHAGDVRFNGNEQRYVLDCLERGWITMGAYIERFEAAFAEYIGVKHAVATTNGTTALHLALTALGIGEKDEVIVPTLSFIATANAVTYTGATPVFCDSNPLDWNLYINQLEGLITPRTKAIIPVHLYGYPCEMGFIRILAKRYNLLVIEDAAEAIGATYDGQRVGSLGNAGCFSFYGNKTITTGEGGMVTTNDDRTAEQLRLLRGQGQSRRRYWHDVVGFNYRMTDLQAAVGLAQMERIDEILSARRQVFGWYQQYLPLPTQKQYSMATPGYWAYAVQLPEGTERDHVMSELTKVGIETRPVFYPAHHMPMYLQTKTFPVADGISRHGIVLPTHPYLTEADIQYISQCLIEVCQ